jgi:hypothetical protein
MAYDLSKLTGRVRTFRPGTQTPYTIPWADVARWEPAFTNAAQEFAVEQLLMPAMSVVESEGNHYRTGKKSGERGDVIQARDDGFGGGRATGILQVKPLLWQAVLPEADAYTPDGNIRLGTALMARFITETGGWQSAIRLKYHPGTDPNSGATPQTYVDTVTSLMAEMRNQLRDAPPPVDPGPVNPVDPYSVIFGGKPYRVEYGFLDDAGLNYYAYGVGHGTQRRTQHTGDDVLVPDETPLYSPFAGVVTCVGWSGSPTWGQGCGYFEDIDGGGVGNITILADSGYKVVLGHSSRAFVSPGQRVAAGQKVGTSGSMNGPHTHVEVAVQRNGTYWLLDPKPALITAMGGVKPAPAPVYAERIDAPQPTEYEGTSAIWTIAATEAGVPVLQSTAPGAPAVRKPLELGEEFTAAYPFTGQDGTLWWMSTTRSRIPWQGTRIVSGLSFGTTSAPCDVKTEIAQLEGVITDIEGIIFALETKA